MLGWKNAVRLIAVMTLSGDVSVSAMERLLTIGGGYSPSGNQVSLEKNVIYYLRILPRLGLEKQPHHILFSDGNDPAPDLRVQDPHDAAGESFHLLARILGSEDGIDERYRNHGISRVNGPSSVQAIDSWFDAQRDWAENDRLIFYFTGHGGGGKKKTSRNTDLRLWNGETMPVTELVKRLDRLPTAAPVVLVMVQCHSGGFADVIFVDGDATRDLSPHQRCGFFSTVPEQVAAGCTSDIDEENYQEYSTYFWAALSGQSRQGNEITPPDYNHDGRVSFNEAHAYVTLTSPTIDLPVKTSDIFLRRYSLLDDDAADALCLVSDYTAVTAVANHIDRTILDGLSVTLGFTGEARVRTAAQQEQELKDKRKEMDKQIGDLRKERDELRAVLAKALKAHWPELANPFHPRLHELLKDSADPILTFIRGQDRCEKFCDLIARIKGLERDKLTLDRQIAKVKRFLRTAENVILEHYLPQNASPAICMRYAALVALESGVLPRDG